MTAYAPARKWRRVTAAASALALSAMGAAMALPAAAAPAPTAADADVNDATLDWGVKASFRNYIYNFAAFEGQATLLGNATQSDEKGPYTWHAGSGAAAADGSAADVSFGEGNGVHFQSHPMEGGYALDLRFTNPRVVVTSATTGELHLDVVGREFVSMTEIGPEYTLTDVTLATLELPAPTAADDVLAWSDAPATLTTEGSEAFGGFYEEGEELDPVSFTLPLTPAEPDSDRSTSAEVAAVSAGDGVTVHVEGSGYDELPEPSIGGTATGVYLALIDTNTSSRDDLNQTQEGLDVAYVPYGDDAESIVDGEFSVDLVAATDDLDADSEFEVIIWVAHGFITPDTELFAASLSLTSAQKEELGLIDAGDADDSDADTDGSGGAEGSTGSDGSDGSNGSNDTGGSDGTGGSSGAAGSSGSTGADDAGDAASGTGAEAAGDGSEAAPTATVVCTTETVPGSAGTPALSWGIKSSFVSYVEGGIAKGSISTGGGAARTGAGFTWGAGSGSLDSGTLSFPGSVHLTGHDGILDLTLSNPQVKITGSNSGVLVATIASQDMEGNRLPGGTIEFADLSFSSLGKDGGTASVTLTTAGAEGFAGFYSAGQAMDDLTVSFSGAKAETTQEVCHDQDGNRVNPDGTPYTGPGGTMATTGADGLTPLLGLVGALTLAGAALLVRSRRLGALDR